MPDVTQIPRSTTQSPTVIHYRPNCFSDDNWQKTIIPSTNEKITFSNVFYLELQLETMFN